MIDHICRIRRGIAAIMFAGVKEDNLLENIPFGCYQACCHHRIGRLGDADRSRYISKTVHVEG